MTIAVGDYFAHRRSDRKKEPRFLAVIDKDSCTSCNACATVCPVDCIYEVVDARPAQSFHVIDTSRCIGCQLCYRIPAESTERYTLEICPWNAIDMLHNPNQNGGWILANYYLGDEDLPWGKLDEYGFQLSLNGQLRIPAADNELNDALKQFCRPIWGRQDDRRRIAQQPTSQEGEEGVTHFLPTDEGRELLQFVFRDYERVFLD